MQQESMPDGGRSRPDGQGTMTIDRSWVGGRLALISIVALAMVACDVAEQVRRDADVGTDDGAGGVGGDDGTDDGGAGGDEGTGGVGGMGDDMGGIGCDPDPDLCAALGDACQMGQGICAAEGTCVCIDDGGKLECDAPPIIPVEEMCNALDDDCDGTVDEDPVLDPCTVGVGICALPGVASCDDSVLTCDGEDDPLAATAESCNGLDDDCDGTTDEALDATPCTSGSGPCTTAGSAVCTDGAPVCDAEPDPTQATDEVCDGIDNDCDGAVDEGLAAEPCTAGFGPCAVPGVSACVNGQAVCEGEPDMALAAEETCNAVDDDCDGGVDLRDGEPVCGALIAERCRAWIGWSDLAFTNPGENYELDGLDTWLDCPESTSVQEGNARCVGTEGLSVFRLLQLPDDGRSISDNDNIGVAFTCDIYDGSETIEEVRVMRLAERACRISIGEATLGGLPPVSDSWAPCPEVPRGATENLLSRCTTTAGRGLFWPIQLGGIFDDETELAIRFTCDVPDGDAVEQEVVETIAQQTQVWLGWAEPGAPGVMDFGRWGTCPDVAEPSGERSSCVGTAGDGCYHRLEVGETRDADRNWRPGWLGVSLTTIAEPDPARPADGSMCGGAP